MIGIVLVTHGRLAEEFVAATEHVVGPQEKMRTICIEPDDDMEARRRDILEAIDEVNDGSGVILLTDMFGGTPTNLALSLHEKDRIEIVTGVNLPMLIKFVNLRDTLSLHPAAGMIAEQGREAIHVASDLLATKQKRSGGTD